MIYTGIPLYDRSSELIKSINKILAEPWTEKQIVQGKKIEVPREWGEDIIGFASVRYKQEGWIVTRIIEVSSKHRTYFLNFRNPRWKKPADQFS